MPTSTSKLEQLKMMRERRQAASKPAKPARLAKAKAAIAAEAKPVRKRREAANGNESKRGEKMKIVRKLLTRASGVTRPEALAATGWESISFQKMAEHLDLKLKLDETGKLTRYFGS